MKRSKAAWHSSHSIGNTTFHDFAMIVYAKFVILDTGTFGLMSALACAGANE